MSKINEQDYTDYLELINDGHSQRSACRILGLKRSTLQDYIKRKQKGMDCVEQEVMNGIIGNDYSNWITKEKPPIRFDVVEDLKEKKPFSKTEPVVLYYDLECSPTNAFIWRRFKENISQAQILNEWYLLTQSWAFNDKEIEGSKLSGAEALAQDDEPLVLQVWHLLNNADIVVGHNLRKFDIKKINARFAYYNLPNPSPYKIIDTYEICKAKFAFPSNKLNDVCSYLGIGVKEDTGGFKTWSECVKGNEDALEHMMRYNLQDVHLTRELYKRLRGFDNNGVNASIMVDQTGMICSTCASDDVEVIEDKFVYTPNGRYQAYRCNSCQTTLRHTTKVGNSNKLVRVTT